MGLRQLLRDGRSRRQTGGGTFRAAWVALHGFLLNIPGYISGALSDRPRACVKSRKLMLDGLQHGWLVLSLGRFGLSQLAHVERRGAGLSLSLDQLTNKNQEEEEEAEEAEEGKIAHVVSVVCLRR